MNSQSVAHLRARYPIKVPEQGALPKSLTYPHGLGYLSLRVQYSRSDPSPVWSVIYHNHRNRKRSITRELASSTDVDVVFLLFDQLVSPFPVKAEQ